METQQMAMPAEMATQGPSPEETAIYDQMRQQISPQEFSNEMLAGASQVDPQAVAEFTEELQSLDVSPEELDALNDLVDQILASPEQYDQLRQQYLAQGMPDDILPEQFDPYFFAALNMAVDQMIAAPTGVQAFAEGGIAELKPIAKAIASYGRNGDTMLAHITPAEARMLKRRGGSGTINPATGLPEFFLKKAFKSIGKAVKKFASSTIGRIVTTVALGFFLGPAAASFMGATSAAGVAAVSGFVGGAGSTLLAGGNLKDALKAGAIGGITAGAIGGVTQGFNTAYTGPTTIGGQVDAFKGMLPGSAPVVDAPAAVPGLDASGQAPVPTQGDIVPKRIGTDYVSSQAPGPINPGPGYDPTNMAAASPGDFGAAPTGGATQPSLVDQTKNFYRENISPSGIREAATPAAQEAGSKAVSELLARVPTATPAMQETAFQTAFKANMPGVMGTYGPMAGVGLGIMGLTGGFQSKSGPGITAEDRRGPSERIRAEGSQKKYFVQGMPGVKYDQFGEPLYGESTPFTTQDPSFALPATIGGIQGVAPPMAMYNTPSGSFGSRQVAQPYNTASMYTNLMGPQRYADGGQVQYFEDGGDVAPTIFGRNTAANAAADKAAADKAAADKAAKDAADRAERAAQKVAADQAKQMRRAAGSGNMYANINAGISALAPESNPMDAADTTFGSRNRQAQLANLQQTYAPMLQGQRNAMIQQSAALGQPARNIPSPLSAPTAMDRNSQLVQDQFARIGRTGFGGQTNQIDIPGFTGFVNQLQSGQMNPADLPGRFDTAVQDYMRANPNDRYTQYVQQFQNTQAAPVKTMNMGGIAGLAQGGYPRRTGQISGPGTEKSDSIPAMLSDGEFVMTAKAVRGAGKGNRRAGAKQMYKLMHQLEKNSERG
jgi:hypothetical protein